LIDENWAVDILSGIVESSSQMDIFCCWAFHSWNVWSSCIFSCVCYWICWGSAMGYRSTEVWLSIFSISPLRFDSHFVVDKSL
jgi:hypothetical protein